MSGNMPGRNVFPVEESMIATIENGVTQEIHRNSIRPNFNKMNPQQSVVDLVVAMVAIPCLIVFALLLETNMTAEWADETQTRWTVLALGMGLLITSLIICGYVTHRMGVCLWAGPQDDSGLYNPNLSRLNSDGTLEHFVDILPPSYEKCMGYDMPPPPYHCIVNLESEIKRPIPDDQLFNHM